MDVCEVLKMGICQNLILLIEVSDSCLWKQQILIGTICPQKESVVVPGGNHVIMPDYTVCVVADFPIPNPKIESW